MSTASGPIADLVVTGRPIRPLGDSEVVEALAIAEGVVVAAGSLDEVSAAARPGATRFDFEGAILPGFCDTHMHFEKIARELGMVQLGEARDIDGALALVAAATQEHPSGEWIQSFGDDNAWHEHRLAERRLPSRSELDAAAPDHPVFLYRGPDAAALNSAAAEALRNQLSSAHGWDADRGHLESPLARVLQEEIPAGRDPVGELEHASERLLAFGITTIVDPGLPAAFDETWRLYCDARSASRVKQRLYLMDRLDHRRDFDSELERVARATPARDATSAGVAGWGLKLLVDGEFADAWMGEGEPQPRPPTRRYTPAQLERALRFCTERTWPICFHVMGRGAAEAVLDALERADPSAFRPSQVTLAHGFLMSRATIDRAVSLGVAISVQPLLAYVFEREMLAAWGEFAHMANPYRLMLDRGADVAGGSDVLPCEPLRGAAVAVTRTSRLGARLGQDQALTPDEALTLFTSRAGSYVLDDRLGTLRPGAPADFACWPRDPRTVPVDDWPALRPDLVATGGEIAWVNPSATPPSLGPKGVPA